jgi:hypothetical protein
MMQDKPAPGVEDDETNFNQSTLNGLYNLMYNK